MEQHGIKICPFCAEEIKEAAIFCRYCGRRVKPDYVRIIVIAIIAIFLAIFLYIHRTQVAKMYYNTKVSMSVFCKNCGEFFDSIRLIPSGVKAMAERNERASLAVEDLINKANQR